MASRLPHTPPDQKPRSGVQQGTTPADGNTLSSVFRDNKAPAQGKGSEVRAGQRQARLRKTPGGNRGPGEPGHSQGEAAGPCPERRNPIL